MPSPLLGYNTNVRHHGKVFHIQTEDSGVAHGHIFTHLFADGGRIVATRKTSYQQHLGTPRYPVVVKALMKAQHKAMFIALRDGLFDEDEMAGAREFALREIVPEDEAGAAPSVVSAPVDLEALERAAAGFEVSIPIAVDTAGLDAAAASYEGGGFEDPVRDPGPSPERPITALDITALGVTSPGRESTAGMTSSPHSASLGASAVFPRPRATSSRPSSTGLPAVGAASSPSLGLAPSSSGREAASARQSSAGKYAATSPVASRPGASASKTKEPPAKDSLFGHDLLSEKSLDEVILSYLADDLDEKK